MAKVHTAAKLICCLWLLGMTGKAKAQRYNGCGYGVRSYSHNNCKKIKPTTLVTTGTKNKAAEIKVYPNPASRSFTLQLPKDYSNQQLKVDVYNAQQELVLTKRIMAKTLQHFIALPLLANGLYQVTVSNEHAAQTILLNIQN